MDKHELLARTKAFALRSLTLVDHLPRTMSGRAIGNQLVRSATSIGANYRPACRLELVLEAKLLPGPKISKLLEEANELTAIFTSARRTSSKNQTSKIKP
jgi:hypothetical protein